MKNIVTPYKTNNTDIKIKSLSASQRDVFQFFLTLTGPFSVCICLPHSGIRHTCKSYRRQTEQINDVQMSCFIKIKQFILVYEEFDMSDNYYAVKDRDISYILKMNLLPNKAQKFFSLLYLYFYILYCVVSTPLKWRQKV